MTHGVRGRSSRPARARGAWLAACSLVALNFGTAAPAQAQATNTPAPNPAPAPPPAQDHESNIDERRIVVIGNRSVVASLEDVPVEQTYDADRLSSYSVSTLGELLGEIRTENGDTEPTVLINGQPISDLGDIADLPVEAIQRVEALPRGAAQRVGGGAGQRAYNVVLRPSVKSATATASREMATEGAWSNTRGELLFTYVKEQDRVNLTLRGAESDALFESDRDVLGRPLTVPYSPLGNLIPISGTQVDPALSALAGQPVSVVALPAGLSQLTPTLAALLPGANQTHPSMQSLYRTLRGSNRPYELALAGNKTLTPWLSLSFNGRLNWIDGESSSGLPGARFVIPATNPFTPFSTGAHLALSDPARPLRSVSDTTNGSLSATLTANLDNWRMTFGARYERRERTYLSDFVPGGLITVDPATNPFGGSLAGLIPVSTRTSHSETSTRQIVADAEGPVLDLWAGPLRARIGVGASWITLDAADTSGARSFKRREYIAKGGLTLPLTSRESGFLADLGDAELTLDLGRLNLGRVGKLDRHSIALNWQPNPWLRITASEVEDERAIAPELLISPTVITPNVPYFDPLTGQTADVTTIYGGAGALTNDELRTRTVSLTVTPLPKNNLQLNADYIVTELYNQIGSLPPPSTPVVAAFPDRFQRDASGTLVLVDNRSVNFAQQHSRQLRLAAGMTLPLSEPVIAPGRRRVPPLRLQLNASHMFLLESTTVIRTGLPKIDLLEGGAIGLGGGGQQRHASELAMALTKGGSGLRLNARRRGPSYLLTGTLAAPNLLTFGPVTTVDVKVFADLGQILPHFKPVNDTRVTVAVENLFNDRQLVRDRLGATPQAYQSVYRDPIGRTILVEVRKVF